METYIQKKPVLKIEAFLGEGPVWDEARRRLYWVDIMAGNLHEFDPAGDTDKVFNTGDPLGAAVLRKSGGFVLASETGFSFFDPATGVKEPVSDPEPGQAGNRFNDGKCDPAGRFWAGTMAYDTTEGAGSLYCLNSALEVETKLQGVTISNGLAWNSEIGSFYFIDSPTGDIVSYSWNEKTGEISGRRLIRHIESSMGQPDGMTIDSEGMLWVALFGGSRVIRINPDDGSTLAEIKLPAPRVTSCTFGGVSLDRLYITTAREGMNRAQLKEAPLSGSLFRVKLPYNGLPANRFAG